MNREIKFRVKTDFEWIYTDLFSIEWEYVKPETVGQWTGLTDKHGKEIYEGDILQFKSQSLLDSWAGKEMVTQIAEIYWNQEELAFYIRNKKVELKPDMRTDNNNFEIIGNIHEDPNLLK